MAESACLFIACCVTRGIQCAKTRRFIGSEPSGKLNGALAFVFCRPSVNLSFLCSYSLDVNEDGVGGIAI